MSQLVKKILYVIVSILALAMIYFLSTGMWDILYFGIAVGGGLQWWCYVAALILCILMAMIILLMLCLYVIWFDDNKDDKDESEDNRTEIN